MDDGWSYVKTVFCVTSHGLIIYEEEFSHSLSRMLRKKKMFIMFHDIHYEACLSLIVFSMCYRCILHVTIMDYVLCMKLDTNSMCADIISSTFMHLQLCVQ